MAPADREALGLLEAAAQAAPPAAPEGRLELARQDRFAAWLTECGWLYLRANPAKKSCIRPGWPDFTIFHAGRVLLLEFKLEGETSSPPQAHVAALLERAGFSRLEVHTALEAIKITEQFFGL